MPLALVEGFIMHRITVVCAAALIASAGLAAGVARAEAPAPETFSAVTPDGVKIVGDYYAAVMANPDTKPSFVILLHQYKADRKTWGPLVEALTQGGISAIAIDLRGHGESTEIVGAPSGGETVQGDLAKRVDEREKEVFKEMHKDIEAVYAWAAESGKVDLSRFGIVGASIGCTVAIDYAGTDRSVDGLLLLSPGEKYMGIRSSVDIKKIEGRGMMMIATPDERADCDALKKANEAAEIDVRMGISGERKLHGTDMLGKVENLERDIVSYLQGKLGNPTKDEERVVASLKGRVFYEPDAPGAARFETSEKRWFSNADEATQRGLRAAGGAVRTQEAPPDVVP
jgi:dienelactone hydrolase